MTRIFINAEQERVWVEATGVLQCCSMLERMHWYHTVVIYEDIFSTSEFWSRGVGPPERNIRSAVERMIGGST